MNFELTLTVCTSRRLLMKKKASVLSIIYGYEMAIKKRLSPVYALRGILSILFTLAPLNANAKITHRFQPIEIKTIDKEIIFADLHLPNTRRPKALIVMVPGTAGLADPFFTGSIKSSKYSPNYKGGLTQALTSIHMVLLSYNQRGYRRLNNCIHGSNEYAREQSFSENCISKNLRKYVGLKTITEDTLSVLLEAQKISKKMGVPLIVLSFSEGTYHISTLLKMKNIAIDGLIGIGSPITTLAETFEQQLRKKYIFEILENALESCNLNGIISVNKIFDCNTKKISVNTKEQIRIILGTEPFETSEITKKKDSVNKIADDILKYYLDLQSPHPITGWLGDRELAENWSSVYFSEIFQDQTNIYHSLSFANLPIHLIYGELDTQVQLPSQFIPRPRVGHIENRIEIKIVDGLDHYLSQDDVQISKSGLEQICQSIKIILRIHEANKLHSATKNR